MPVYGYKQTTWKPQFQLLSFSFPQIVPQDHYYYMRKYRMHVYYKSKTSPKVLRKVIYFGFKGNQNLIDGNMRANNKKKRQDLFHPYFWQTILLNNKGTLNEAYQDAKNKLLS